MQARIKTKNDTTANWNAALGFVPLKGEIIVYTDYESYTAEENGVTVTKYIPGIKIGDGLAYVQDLPFVSDDIRMSLLQHVEDLSVHVTAAEKQFWNNKINIDDSYDILIDELDNETLVFNRN